MVVDAIFILTAQESSARLGRELAEEAEKTGAGPVLWILGLLALIVIFGFMIKMRMDGD